MSGRSVNDFIRRHKHTPARAPTHARALSERLTEDSKAHILPGTHLPSRVYISHFINSVENAKSYLKTCDPRSGALGPCSRHLKVDEAARAFVRLQ